ncbi:MULTISPECIES: mechanosensitive ion channel family protein [unclassified Ornithinimicrobium]|uniref:mechanosensitive ion channel family protein n=1 Tax=unclassified Ornithinimicrobium TaxID=2615080 RepID=UPI003851D4E4
MPDVNRLMADLGPGWSGALVLALTLLLSLVIHRALTRGIDGADGQRHTGRQVGRLVSVAVFVLGSLWALRTSGLEVGPLLGAMGVGGIAVAFAAQDLLQNFLAGLLIQARRPFKVGDQITSLDYEGTVLDIDLRATRLRTYDGLDVVLPNAEVLRNPIVNHTRTPLRRTTLVVGVAYDTDLARAQRVLTESLTGIAELQNTPTPKAWVKEFADSSITFEVLFWHPSDMASTLTARSAAAMAVKRDLDQAGIEIPFPQRVVWRAPGHGGPDGSG